MRRSNIIIWTFIMMCSLSIMSGAYGQQKSAADDLIEGILEDIIDRTVDAARDDVRRNTGIDPFERGYDPDKRYRPWRGARSDETRRKLRQLNAKHDRKIADLETELQGKLAKAEDKFQREAAKEDKPEKIAEKRDKLERKVDAAYAKFEAKIDKENARFDEKRAEILNKDQRD